VTPNDGRTLSYGVTYRALWRRFQKRAGKEAAATRRPTHLEAQPGPTILHQPTKKISRFVNENFRFDSI
jgi:hypothetical protein